MAKDNNVAEKEHTRGSALARAEQVLGESGVDDARLNAQLLLAHVLKCERTELLLRRHDRLTEIEAKEFQDLVKRRCGREPLQYLVGETDFMGFRIFVDPRVLIPRPETEVLVETLVGILAEGGMGETMQLLDIGTGSGNIAISIASRIKSCVFDALDVSADALDVARRNITYHHMEEKIHCIRGDVMTDRWYDPARRYHAIVSNPPYIPISEFDGLQPEIRVFEPEFATTDGGDGLSFYRRIAVLGQRLLVPGGSIFLEIAYNMSDRVSEIFAKTGYSHFRVLNDYDQNPRVLIVKG